MAVGVDRNRDEMALRQTRKKELSRSASDVRDTHRTTRGGYQLPTIRRDIMCARCTLQAEPVKDVPTSPYVGYSDETLHWLESYKPAILLTGRTFRDHGAQPPFQALSRAFPQVNHLLPRGAEQLSNRHIIQR